MIRIAVLSAATCVAALGLSGCSNDERPAAAPPPPATSSLITPAPPPAAPLPAPDALTGVLYRLADVNVPGANKVGLVEHSTSDDAAALDKFGRALADYGFTPLDFEAKDLAWSQSTAGNVVATITVTTPSANGQGKQFSFPMEFTPHGTDWLLTRHTADMLLELGRTATPEPASPTPVPPTPTP
ncbi:hypothetical protein BTO20_13980 [Mycobacterium dioxanotrophicus]|uniref:Low molecular weight antigen MTB12-like C-terminal domain-containing protein n=1 Tax=Mycobacterium dioxanotrophicus TaxID=482462 RepID=A0A1Y0C2Y9_9MYCO|nr:hypothetical protein BTO20_13980 [Mycobacterium dioxanotrophicus]